jgi:hypothetical protein
MHDLSQSEKMPTYTIAELAREFDITARAIRFYEDQGLLSPIARRPGRPQPRLHAARPHPPQADPARQAPGPDAVGDQEHGRHVRKSPKDTSAQMNRFLGVLAHQRETLEQQREDIEMSLAEITVHEDECWRRCWPRSGVRRKGACGAERKPGGDPGWLMPNEYKLGRSRDAHLTFTLTSLRVSSHRHPAKTTRTRTTCCISQA